jgi:hypothetical protein
MTTLSSAPTDVFADENPLDAFVAHLIDNGAKAIGLDDVARAPLGANALESLTNKCLIEAIERVGQDRGIEIVGLRDLDTGRYRLEHVDPHDTDFSARFDDAVRRRLECRPNRIRIGQIPKRYHGTDSRAEAAGRLEDAIDRLGASFGARISGVLESMPPIFCLSYTANNGGRTRRTLTTA